MTRITINFDDMSVYQRFMENEAHHILVDLVRWLFDVGLVKEIVNTSNYREGDESVHGTQPYRGLDIRSHGMKNPQGLVDMVNDHWQYDSVRPEKMCALFHDVGRGLHIHLQVHPNTVLIKGGW